EPLAYDGKEYYLNQTCLSQLFEKCSLFFFTLQLYQEFFKLIEVAVFLKFMDSNYFMLDDHFSIGLELKDLKIPFHFFRSNF
ncbi:MAG: hypothetical protein ACK55Z_32250, partial [bacterium]